MSDDRRGTRHAVSRRKLFIHAGPTKTGTSAIQSVLREHDNSVVIYPKVGLWGDGAHHNLVFNFYADQTRPEIVHEDVGAMFAQIAREAQESDRNIVISSEVLGGRKAPRKFVRALLAQLGTEFEAEILLGVREHFERAASIYNQRVKDGVICERRGPDEFLAAHFANMLYAPMLARLKPTEFRIVPVCYHPAETFVPRFLARLGFASHQAGHPGRRNVSLSVKGLVATLAANRVAPSREERDRMFEALRCMPGFFGPSRFIFTRDTASSVETHFAADRLALRDAFALALEAPDIGRSVCVFQISGTEFEEIAAVTAGLGETGRALRDEARPFLGAR